MTYSLYLDDLVTGRGAARARFEEALRGDPVAAPAPAKPVVSADGKVDAKRWGMGKQAYENQQAAMRLMAGGG